MNVLGVKLSQDEVDAVRGAMVNSGRVVTSTGVRHSLAEKGIIKADWLPVLTETGLKLRWALTA